MARRGRSTRASRGCGRREPTSRRPSRDLLGGQRALGGEQRVEHRAARGGDAQAVGAHGVRAARAATRRRRCGRACLSSDWGGAAPARRLSMPSSAAAAHLDHTELRDGLERSARRRRTTISAAETAEARPASRPGRSRASACDACTTAMPRPVSVAARPSAERDDQDQPEPDLVLRDRAEQDDERRRAGDEARPTRRCARIDRVGGACVPCRGGGGDGRGGARGACVIAPAQHRQRRRRPRAARRRGSATGTASSGRIELRQRERDDAEREHAGRVRDRDGRAERDGVARACRACRRGRRRPSPCRGRARARAARPSRTPRASSRISTPPPAARRRRCRRSRPAAPRRSRRAAALRASGRGHRAVRRGDASSVADADVGGASRQVLRVAAQPAGRVGGRARSSARRSRARAAATTAFQPTRPGERAVVHRDAPRGVHARGQRQLDARRRQPALPGRMREPWRRRR